MRVRICPLLQNRIAYLELHILLLNPSQSVFSTAFLVDFEGIPSFIVWVGQLSIFVSIWCFKHSGVAILDHDDLPGALLHEDGTSSLMHSSMVAQQSFVSFSSWWLALSIFNLEPTHCFSIKQACSRILLFLIAVAALSFIKYLLIIQEHPWNLIQPKVVVQGHRY